MSHENETFRKAARDAGISGKDWQGNTALKDFSQHYHNTWSKSEREQDGYHGIYDKAVSWWSSNSRRYS